MTTIAPCEHGSPAKYVTVVDRTRITERDPYGDIAGPMNVTHADAMETIRKHKADEHADEPGRFVLGFVHTDRCRTGNTDPTTRITDPAITAAAVAEAEYAERRQRHRHYIHMSRDDLSTLGAFVQVFHPAVFDEAVEFIREQREKREEETT